MSGFNEKDPVELVNASLVVEKAGLRLIPLSRDGQPYPQQYHFHVLAKTKFLTIAPAGTRFKYSGQSGENPDHAVVEGAEHCLSTPAWNIRAAAG